MTEGADPDALFDEEGLQDGHIDRLMGLHHADGAEHPCLAYAGVRIERQ